MSKQAGMALSPGASGNAGFVAVTTTPYTTTPTVAWDRSVRDAPRHGALHHKEAAEKRVESAVFAHIRALRALGRTDVNVRAIADALEIDQARVLAAVHGLSKKGVKIK